MRALSLLAAAAICLPAASLPAFAYQAQHEPGTGSTQVAPASQAPAPVQAPDVRLDSKPHTSIDASLDSSIPPPDLGLGAFPAIDLGHDITATTPAGMLSESEPGNPRMVYFSLPQRSPDQVTQEDKAILTARQADLAGMAHGAGTYQQSVCPAMQPDAETRIGVAAAGDGAGFLLLHLPEGAAARKGHTAGVTAIVPRASGLPVRGSSDLLLEPDKKQKKNKDKFLKAKFDRGLVNEALPPATLYGNLRPVQDWIAASACLAELAGAHPRIPNEPFLNEEVLLAPEPTLRLMLSGERKVVFADRVSDSEYVIWNQHVARGGRLVKAEYEPVRIVPRPITNPPVPASQRIANIPQPPSHVGPEPPSPLLGTKQ